MTTYQLPTLYSPQDAIPLQDASRILLIKLRQMGDVLLTSPMFSILKRHFPELQVDALIYEEARPLLAHNPAVRFVYSVDRNWRRLTFLERISRELALTMKLRRNRYDMVINLTEGDRGAFAAIASGARWRVGRYEAQNAGFIGKQRIFTHLYRVQDDRRHAVEQHLDALRRIGLRIPVEHEPLRLYIPEAAKITALSKLREAGWKGQPYVLVSPTSRCIYKCLPPHTVVEVIDTICNEGYLVVITGGSNLAEIAMVKDILSRTKASVIDLSGKLDLLELGAIIKESIIFLGSDSLPMHMAAALQIPTIAWFGPLQDVVWGPWLVPNRVVTMSIGCRPCGYEGCGDGMVSECLMGLKADDIIAAMQELLAQQAHYS